ncbi:MAG: hypothetical protein ACREMX_06830 [Gemmatimonadales bacterium]
MRYLFLTLMPLVLACYTYRPLPAPEPARGQRISAPLTDQGSRDLSGQVGPEVLHVEGDVVQADSAGFELSVRQTETYRGVQTSWRGERVRLPRAALAGLQERRLSVGGTGVLGGALAVGLYAMYRVLGGPGLLEGGDGQAGGGDR